MKQQIPVLLLLPGLLLGLIFCTVSSGLSYMGGVSSVPTQQPIPTPVNIDEQLIYQHARGAYDMCTTLYVYSGGSDEEAISNCNKMVTESVLKNDWYHDGSFGFSP